jgi:fatty acid-binding protein DegV
MLSFKPIISLKDGVVIPLEQPRTRSKAYARVTQLVRELGELESLTVAETNEEAGQQLCDALKTIYPHEISRYKLGAVIGTHSGPGTVAVSAVTAP